MTKKIKAFEIVNHGVHAPDYFQGCGTYGTEFDVAYTGAGFSSLKSALEDALEQMSGEYDIDSCPDLLADVNVASDYDEVEHVNAQYRPALKYEVKHVGYCGMLNTTQEFESEQDAREYVAERIKALSREFEVAQLDDATWEVLEPEDNAGLVPDACGTISLTDNQEEVDHYNENTDVVYYATIRVRGE